MVAEWKKMWVRMNGGKGKWKKCFRQDLRDLLDLFFFLSDEGQRRNDIPQGGIPYGVYGRKDGDRTTSLRRDQRGE